jgi:hypothetical protein
MMARMCFCFSLAMACMVLLLGSLPAPGCCPAPPPGKPVVNADQTVIMIWDGTAKTQHFIRRASFKSEADDFGFLVPTPSEPVLEESGNEAFPYLQKLTEPENKKVPRPSGGMSCGCGGQRLTIADKAAVIVLQEKVVAGFNAVVLETRSADALVGWLKDHGYVFSPEVEAWAKPYVEAGWKITALKVAKDKESKDQSVAASSLRITFKTDRPLFPYREPDSTKNAAALGAKQRLLRIYFLADARYRGDLTPDVPWTGKVAWADKLTSEQRTKVLEMLKLPETTGPEQWWLTEFEDAWPYRVAPGDVYFVRDADQNSVKRPPIVEYVSSPFPADVTIYAIAAALVVPPLWRRARRGYQG